MNEFKDLVNKLIEIEKRKTKKGYKNESLFCLCCTLALIRGFEKGRIGIFDITPYWVRMAGEAIYIKLLEEEKKDDK